PFPGQEARIVDRDTRQPLPVGQIGEIQVRGPHLFQGYWRNPVATAAAFTADGWFNSGDLGFVDADGYFHITGRSRDLIISGGYNIYPREVEEVLAQHPAVAECAVYGQPDPDLGEVPVAAVVIRPYPPVTATELIDHCRANLAAYKRPRAIRFVSALPRNALGKVQRHLLATDPPVAGEGL
ncbi:MAG: class I adenylate-forming enzyme family protein, partial [Chloroflexus sp.]